MNNIGSSILIIILFVLVYLGYILLIKIPQLQNVLRPFSQNWYMLIATVFILSMCIGLNVAQLHESWSFFIFVMALMILLFIDLFSTKNSTYRRLTLIILSIGFLVGSCVRSVDKDYSWIAYLICLIFVFSIITFFVLTKKFNEPLNIKSLFNLITNKTLFIYFVISFTLVSLIFQYIQFSSNVKLGSFTIVLTALFVFFTLYVVIKNPLSKVTIPISLR
jgi:hypothetical protein